MIYDISAMSTPMTIASRGKTFTVMCTPEMWHPSWWSFMDEVATREAWWYVEPGDVVLDVGADFGSYAMSALAQGAGRVVAWSPPFKLQSEPIEAETMIRTAMQNPGFQERLRVLASGLWSEIGWLAAFDGPRNAEFYGNPEDAWAALVGFPGHCSVFAVTPLDAFEFDKADWLKIDTEGCELAILKGGVETIKKCRPRILLEHHYHLDPDCEKKCDEFLEALGYKKHGTRPHHSIAHSLYIHMDRG